MGRPIDETCEDVAILMTGLLFLMLRKKSDLCKRAHLAKTGNGPCLNSSDQDLYDRERTSNNVKIVKLSDLNKRANLANSGNGPCPNNSDQVLYNRERATDKK